MPLALSLKTALVAIHVLGAAIGVGGVLMLDFYLLKFVRGSKIKARDLATVSYVSLFVKAGLFVVWTSGILVIASSPDGAAAVLANPKLQAKLLIVVVLTLNALFIETLVLPLIRSNLKRTLFHDASGTRRMLMLVFGAISTTSWTFPLLLGLAREWNRVVPAGAILEIYACAVVCVSAGLCLAFKAFYPSAPRPAKTTAVETAVNEILARILDLQVTMLEQQAALMRGTGDHTGATVNLPEHEPHRTQAA